jgi:hypothetical protein
MMTKIELGSYWIQVGQVSSPRYQVNPSLWPEVIIRLSGGVAHVNPTMHAVYQSVDVIDLLQEMSGEDLILARGAQSVRFNIPGNPWEFIRRVSTALPAGMTLSGGMRIDTRDALVREVREVIIESNHLAQTMMSMYIGDPMQRLKIIRMIPYWYEELGRNDIWWALDTRACTEAIEELSRVETLQLSWEGPS